MFFTLTLENKNGDCICMTETANKYITSSLTGHSPPMGTINTAVYAGMDGSYLNNALIEKRNIVITFEVRGVGVEARRHQLYKVVKSSRYVKVLYKTAAVDVYAEGYVETCDVTNFGQLVSGQISIICPDIYRYSNEPIYAVYSQINGAFHFPFPESDKPFTLGTFGNNQDMVIENIKIETSTAMEDATGSTALLSVGKCGVNVSFALFSNGNVKLTGSGSTADYSSSSPSPFDGDSSIKNINIGYGITKLGNNLFEDCNNLESVYLPNSVTEIGDYAFSITEPYAAVTRGLKEVTLPSNLKSIGKYAFQHTRLTSLTVPASVTTISDYAFADCGKLKIVRIDSAVMGSYMFTYCKNLSSVTISKNCKTFGLYMFPYCEKLSTINYEGTMAQWKSISKSDHWIINGDNLYIMKIQCSNGSINYDAAKHGRK